MFKLSKTHRLLIKLLLRVIKRGKDLSTATYNGTRITVNARSETTKFAPKRNLKQI